MPSAVERQAVAGAVADEEDAVLGRGPQPVRDPVALVADGVALEVRGELARRLLDVVARVEGADADAQLAAGREAPGVAGGGRSERSIHTSRSSPRAVRMDLQPARETGVGRLDRSRLRRAPGASRARR